MALDPALVAALAQAVEEAGQPRAVGLRLQAWLEALSVGEDAPEAQAQRYEAVRDAIDLGRGADED